MPVQVPTIQAGPATVRTLDAIGDDHMGVRQRIALTRGAVIEPHYQQASAAHLVMPTMPTARAHLAVQVGDRSAHAFVMSAHHCPPFALTAECVHHAHVLDWSQH
jgi:hypothetical protein